jgi:hypothetical protein
VQLTIHALRRGNHLQRISAHWPYAVVLAVFLLLLPLSTPRLYATDEVQYYAYLRSLYFDGDLDFANEYRAFAERNPRSGIEQALLTERRVNPANGLYGNVAPIGAALLWAPFFVVADGIVLLANAMFGAGISRDGYSQPYIAAVCYASALYGLLGLLLTLRLARRYASDWAATLATITIWLATPLFWYMFIHMPWSHAPGLFAVALFLTVWQQTRSPGPVTTRGWRAWLVLGALGGLMTMVREQLGLFLLIPAVEALIAYGALVRLRAWPRLGRLFVLHSAFLLALVLALTPQLVTWQVLNGGAPAREVSDKIKWCSPHIIDTLIDFDPSPEPWCDLPNAVSLNFTPFSHGAFLWSPILPFGLIGLALLWRRDRLLGLVLALAFLGQTYLNGALSTWHLSAAFGFRRLIECTPIFVLGLALLADRLGERTGRSLLLVLALLFVGWNFSLALNWALLHPNEIRQGLVWPELFWWQLEAPFRAAGRLGALLFDRCRFFENGSC